MPFSIDGTGGRDRIIIPTNEYGTPYPMNLLVYGNVGSGKSIAAEQIVNFYYRNGYTIISLSDVKDTIEFGFSMFPPKARYHLWNLRKFNCPQHRMPVKIYHPYSPELRKGIKYPDINFYTISIKNLTRTDLNYLAESNENKRSIQIILEELSKLSKHDGLWHLVFRADERTESIANLTKSTMRYRSDDPNTFFTRSKLGTEKTSSEMNSYFQPFITNHSLMPHSFPHNIDIKQIMNDQQHYHIFTTKWVKDDRLKRFYILHLLHSIINNADAAKNPILIYLEEIRYLSPAKDDGANRFLAEEIKREMTRFRNMGMGFGIVGTTQTYWDVHPEVLGSFNEIIIGKITDPKETEKICKSLRFTQQDTKILQSLQTGHFIVKCRDEFTDEPTWQNIRLFAPPHAHAEGGDSFMLLYQKHYPEKMKTINQFLEDIETTKQRLIEEVSILKDKENITKRDAEKRERESKLEKEKLRIKVEMQKLQRGSEKKEVVDDQLKQLIYQEWQNAIGKDKSLRNIAKKFNLVVKTTGEPNATAVKRAIDYMRRKEPNNNTDTTNDTTDDNNEETPSAEELYDDNNDNTND